MMRISDIAKIHNMHMTGKPKTGSRNDVGFFENSSGDRYVGKIYRNSYRPTQGKYEENILSELKNKPYTPNVYASGITPDGKMYVLQERMPGLNVKEMYNYQSAKLCLSLLSDLHKTEVNLDTLASAKDNQECLSKALSYMDDDVKHLYEKTTPTRQVYGFIHGHAHMEHFLQTGFSVSLVDFEDAHYADVRVDYAALAKDMLEAHVPRKDIIRLVLQSPGSPQALMHHIARRYISDAYWQKKGQDHVQKAKVFLGDFSVHEKLGKILG